jgi:hypothetical protein
MYKMVHKNYKWNISEEKGRNMTYNLIETILKEKKDNTIDIDELTFLLNNRTKSITITNNNKTKNLTNYMKVVFGGMINFIDDYDIFLLQKKESGTFIKLNNIGMSDWIFVDDDCE